MGAGGQRRLIDLSHEVADGMPAYPGLPAPVIRPFKARAETASWYTDGSTFEITRVDLVTGVGTYLHAPWHRYPEGTDLAGLALESLADLPGLRVEARSRPGRAIERNLLAGADVRGKAVLFNTGWASRWGTPGYWEAGPYLTEETCTRLIEQGAVLVGADCWNVDDTATKARPIHSALLKAGVIVVENLCNLEALPAEGIRVHAVPTKFRRCDSFPVRAYAVLDANP